MKKRECLGIDIGGTTAKYAIIGEDGSVRNEDFFPTGRKMNRQEFLQELFQVTDRARGCCGYRYLQSGNS